MASSHKMIEFIWTVTNWSLITYANWGVHSLPSRSWTNYSDESDAKLLIEKRFEETAANSFHPSKYYSKISSEVIVFPVLKRQSQASRSIKQFLFIYSLIFHLLLLLALYFLMI
jgi:hypothetical protein